MADPISLGIQVAVMAVNMALTASRKIEGPRQDNLKFSGGDPGAPWPNIYGMVRTFGVPIWARDLQEVKQRRKTKGGKYNDYTYFADFAVGCAQHEVDAVRRIWLDKKLVYDMSGAGPVTPFDFGGTGAVEDFLAIYLGTADQDPDPYMLALVEADLGEGFCPAYRNRAYVIFKHIPVEKFGNRFPQPEFEVVRNKTPHYPYSEIDIGTAGSFPIFSPDYSTLSFTDLTTYVVVDTAAQVIIATADMDPLPRSIFDSHAYISGGAIIYGTTTNQVMSQPVGGGLALELFTMSGPSNGTAMSTVDGNGDDHYLIFTTSNLYFDGVVVTGMEPYAMVFTDAYGDVWLVGKDAITGATQAIFRRMTGQYKEVIATLPSHNLYPLAFHYADATHNHFVLGWNGMLYLIDPDDGAILDSSTPSSPSSMWLQGFKAIRPGASSFWVGFEEISSVDLSSIRALDKRDWVGGISVNSKTIYDPINHALVDGFNSGAPKVWYYLDRINSSGMTLGDIETDVAIRLGITAYDFSAHTQVVPGWKFTQGQGTNAIEPLHGIFDATIRPHGFEVQGINFTGTSTGTILTEKFVAGDPRYTVKIRQGAELPRAVTFNFSDNEHDHQTNNVRVERPLDATGARGDQSYDLTPFASTVTAMRGYGERYFRRMWNEREEVTNALTSQYIALEAGDCKTLDLDGDSAIYRCTRVTLRADDSLATEWKYDHPSLVTIDATAGASFDRPESSIPVAVLSRGFFLDTPYISDSDARTAPSIYVLAGPYATGAWPGATAYQAIDGEYTEEVASIVSSSAATWGSVAEVLPSANPNVWDRGNSLTVTLGYGTLTSATEDACYADASLNLAAIGAMGRWEIVQFTTATLTAPLTYTLSGFRRGRRGTEWAGELHAAGDSFVLLDHAVMAAMGLSEVGTDLSFKAITEGRSSAFPVDMAPFTGASLKPWSPCRLRGLRDFGTNDWALTWERRTRVGGAWRPGATIPLSETTEEYELEVMNGASVVRTVTGLTSPAWTYSSANQVTDFGSNQSAVTYRVYQMSDAVGRGFVTTATV